MVEGMSESFVVDECNVKSVTVEDYYAVFAPECFYYLSGR
jgi:hypothetical protein